MLLQIFWSLLLFMTLNLQWNWVVLFTNKDEENLLKLFTVFMGNAQDVETSNEQQNSASNEDVQPPPAKEISSQNSCSAFNERRLISTARESVSHEENYFDAGSEDCRGPEAEEEEDMSGIRGTYFRDGMRKIDYVLAYTEDEKKPAEPKHLRFRKTYLTNLQKCHIDTEMEITDDRGTKLHFIKCHCPFDILRDYAEELAFKAPLERRDADRLNWSEMMLSRLHFPNPFYEDVPNPPPDFFTATFRADKFHLFIGSEEPETYFTDVERIRICHEILETAPYGRKRRGEIGIERLVEEGVFAAAYPLHGGPYKIPKEEISVMLAGDSYLNDRQNPLDKLLY